MRDIRDRRPFKSAAVFCTLMNVCSVWSSQPATPAGQKAHSAECKLAGNAAIIMPSSEGQTMKWVCAALFVTFYAGGVVGSFEIYKVRFSCVLLKDIDSKTCGAAVWVNSFAWPYNGGRRLARWSHEHDGEHFPLR